MGGEPEQDASEEKQKAVQRFIPRPHLLLGATYLGHHRRLFGYSQRDHRRSTGPRGQHRDGHLHRLRPAESGRSEQEGHRLCKREKHEVIYAYSLTTSVHS